MWTHVYVQQANSVFAGETGPNNPKDPSRRHHKLHYAHQGEFRKLTPMEEAFGVGDKPSGEDQTANFYGVSHFPCCITNFPQGWPKFAQHVYLFDNNTMGGDSALLVASLVPSKASFIAGNGEHVTVETESGYPFGDTATVTMVAKSNVNLKVRIPGWASKATVNGQLVMNGTTWSTPVKGSVTVKIDLNPEVKAEFGWGDLGNATRAPMNAVALTRGPIVFAYHPKEEKKVVKTYSDKLPVRPLAVDYAIGTSDPWNYALVVQNETSSWAKFVSTSSSGWKSSYPFDDSGQYPFYIEVEAKLAPQWGFWEGSMITDNVPPSPLNVSGEVTKLKLTPFGGTNIRISVFPWTVTQD